MGHAREVYFPHQCSELSENRRVWGLDKNWVIAPEMVQKGNWHALTPANTTTRNGNNEQRSA
jgi:hypothetical protein